MLTWGGANVFARVSMTISERGEVVHVIEKGGGQRTQTSLKLSQAELRELVDLIKSDDVCSLVHDPSYTPVPDESMTKLVVDLPSLRCTIELRDGEWEKRANDFDAAIRRVATRAQDAR